MKNTINSHLHIVTHIFVVALGLLLIIFDANFSQLTKTTIIPWYGITAVFGLFLVIGFIYKELEKVKIVINDTQVAMVVLVGIISARFGHILSEWFKIYQYNPLSSFYIWQGGLSWYGGILGGLLAIVIIARKYQMNLVLLLPVIVRYLPLGQSIARFGNYFNHELYGTTTELPWFITVNGIKVHPVFWYEQIGNLLLALLLNYLYISKDSKVKSYLTAIYLIGYSIIRLLIEQLRTDTDWLMKGISFGESLAIFSILLGIIIIIYNKLIQDKNIRTSDE